MIQALTYIAAVAGGYVAAIFTWTKVHAWIIGVEAKAEKLRAAARELVTKARAL